MTILQNLTPAKPHRHTLPTLAKCIELATSRMKQKSANKTYRPGYKCSYVTLNSFFVFVFVFFNKPKYNTEVGTAGI